MYLSIELWWPGWREIWHSIWDPTLSIKMLGLGFRLWKPLMHICIDADTIDFLGGMDISVVNDTLIYLVCMSPFLHHDLMIHGSVI